MIAPALNSFLMSLLTDAAGPAVPPPPEDLAQWESLIEDAEAEGLTQLLSGWLHALPERRRTFAAAVELIRPILVKIAAQNLVLAEELSSLLRRFQDHRLPCIPIRGPALAEQLYGDVTARAMGDLDLLVPRDRLPEIAGLLTDAGYREIDRRPGFARTFSYTLEFVKKRHGWIYVEPHWTIAYPPVADRIDMDSVWQRAVPGHVAGVNTLLLNRTDLLLHLCFHLLHKREQAPLLWWRELALLIRQEPAAIDWAQVLRMAKQTGQGELLAETLGQVRALFRSPVPEPVLAQLAVQPEQTSRNFLRRRLAPLLRGDSCVDGRESLAQLLVLKGFPAKWRYACGILFPSSEFMRAHYGLTGRPWLGYHYAARLLHLLWEGGKGLAELALRPSSRQSSLR
ncbi:MAG: hypothetical protein EPO61_13835 [Nitrospirae bacterium]|nr:MAG: hypothetical protein EPO61_13835 [Nitrospirota bacterium]